MNNECPICFIELDNIFSVNTPCKHTLCLECFVQLQDNTCPICRGRLKRTHVSAIKQKYKEEFKLNNVDFPPLG